MTSILVLFAHPALERSRIHSAWVEAIRGLSGITIRDLYQLYPEFDIDVPAEQHALVEHDLVVLQHPFYWYSTPAIVKQWFDLVLEHGWAYGSEGNALAGKGLLSAISTGGTEDSYRVGGYHDITVLELLAPIRQTARLCNMKYLPPLVAHGAFTMTEKEVGLSAEKYRSTLESLRDGLTDWRGAREEESP